MARSLLVVLALVAALVMLVPRVSSVQRDAVDARAVVAYAVTQSAVPFSFPEELPEGWTANHARFSTTDGAPTWQAGWVTPSGAFVGLREGRGVSAGWLAAAQVKGQAAAAVDIAGRSWQRRTDDRGQQSLTSTSAQTGVATVVTLTGPLDEARVLIERLRPVAPTG